LGFTVADGSENSMSLHEQESLEVKVELINLIHSRDFTHSEDQRPHAFAYHLKITNESTVGIVLNRRKWILQYDDERFEVYQGDHIVGKIVELEPGEHFEYSSYHMVAENCVVSGAYHGQTVAGEPIWVRIPKFPLHIPG
jgi:ApaG protein